MRQTPSRQAPSKRPRSPGLDAILTVSLCRWRHLQGLRVVKGCFEGCKTAKLVILVTHAKRHVAMQINLLCAEISNTPGVKNASCPSISFRVFLWLSARLVLFAPCWRRRSSRESSCCCCVRVPSGQGGLEIPFHSVPALASRVLVLCVSRHFSPHRLSADGLRYQNAVADDYCGSQRVVGDH